MEKWGGQMRQFRRRMTPSLPHWEFTRLNEPVAARFAPVAKADCRHVLAACTKWSSERSAHRHE
jgi:hypothetical protein